MPDLAPYAPLIVPVLIGLILLRLGLELLFAQTRQGQLRVEAVRRAWSNYTTAMGLGAFVLPFLRSFLGFSVQATPLWLFFMVGLVLSAIHNAVLTRSLRASPGRTAPLPVPTATAQATAHGAAQQVQQATSNPKANRSARPSQAHQTLPNQKPAAASPLPQRQLSTLPLPQPRAGRAMPVPSEQVESWYERQDARLERTLSGQSLAAARLRLSTVKSMLLLGQISVGEADGDVNMVLQRAGG